MKRLLFFILMLLAYKGLSQSFRCDSIGFSRIYPNSTLIFNGLPIPVSPAPNPDPPTPDGDSENRYIFWVHGLGGDQNSWSHAAFATAFGSGTDFPARKAFCPTIPQYVNTGLEQAGYDLNTTKLPPLDQDPEPNPLNFIIAHSQGGLVSRMADKLLEDLPSQFDDRHFFGIVTFGTPHSGARILNSRNEGLLTQFTKDACNTILQPRVFDLIASTPLLNIFVNPDSVTKTVDNLCSAFGGTLIPVLLSPLYAPISSDYPEGSPLVNELNAFGGSPGLPRTAFVGIEYDSTDNNTANPKQLFWRTMSSYSLVQSGLPDSTFGDNDDSRLVDAIMKMKTDYQAKYEEWVHKVDELSSLDCPWWLAWNPGVCLLAHGYDQFALDNAEAAEKAYGEGLWWLKNADDQWKVIIGALEFEENGNCVCYRRSTEPASPWDDEFIFDTISEIECDLLDPDYDAGCSWTVFYDKIYNESDGVVTKESASAFPGANYVRRMEQTNHFQMRNCTQTKEALTKLYEGYAGEFFTTDKL